MEKENVCINTIRYVEIVHFELGAFPLFFSFSTIPLLLRLEEIRDCSHNQKKGGFMKGQICHPSCFLNTFG